jgi:hypothetical protein
MGIVDNIKATLNRYNKEGVPLPMIRDPKTGKGSVSLTMLFISFNVVLIGLAGKFAGAFGGIDITQALALFYACGTMYLGRKFQKSNTATLDPAQKTDQPLDLDPK